MKNLLFLFSLLFILSSTYGQIYYVKELRLDSIRALSSDFKIGGSGESVTISADTVEIEGVVRIGSYTTHLDIVAGAAVLGPTAPDFVTVGTYRGIEFDADADAAFFAPEVPVSWDTTSDMTLVIHWASEDEDIIQNGETVKWDAHYRITGEGDSLDHGTIVVATTTFTGGASEVNVEHYHTEITLDYNDANQPIVIGKSFGFMFDRDVGADTYTGGATVIRWDLEYTANKIPAH